MYLYVLYQKHHFMKKIIITTLTLLFSVSLFSQTPMTYEEKISYIIGYNVGQNLSQAPFTFEVDAILKGMEAAFNRQQSEISEQEMQMLMQEWQIKMQEAQQNRTNAEAEIHKAEGMAFLEKNKEDKDVIVTESGLQYKVVTMGSGDKPNSPTDRVTVHYEGKLLDGTIFDSSYGGKTVSFTLNQVIRGWTEGLQLMPVGSTFIFYIPSELAYGDNQRPGSPIPAGSTLIFTVELFDIVE